MFRRLIVSRGSCALVLHQFNFFDGCEDFVASVAHALVRAASTLVSTLGVISNWLRLRRFAGRSIPAAAAFRRLRGLHSPPHHMAKPLAVL